MGANADEPGEENVPVSISLFLGASGDQWVARDEETGVASQGATRQEALENLDEAVALYTGEIGESVGTPEAERAVLRDLGIDPDEVAAARDENVELPEFMQ